MRGSLREKFERTPVSAVILTCNEEKNVEDCLKNLVDCVGEIFIVDSGSTDRTKEFAERYGAKVVFHPFETHAKQWNWAFQNLPLSREWVLALDADQRLSPELQEEIRSALAGALDDTDGFYLRRKQIFLGRWIQYGGYYPKYLLKSGLELLMKI